MNIKLIFKVKYILLFGALFLTSFSQAKEMPQRLGLGLKNNTSESIPSVAVVYHLSKSTAVTGGFGLDTAKDNSNLQLHVGFRNVIFHESNLHFYTGGQLGILNYETLATGKRSGIDATLVFGTEFFFAGLENLGLTFEAGFGLSTIGSTRVRTVASDPFKAGIIFYF